MPDIDSAETTRDMPLGRRRDYVPCAEPGSRLPHMYVKALSNLSSQVSSIIVDCICFV